MADYTAKHASAHAKIKAAGAAITFSRDERTDYDAEAGTSTITTTTVAGVAVRVRGNPKVYDILGLIESEAPTLLFAANTFMEVPELGMKGTWGGTKFTVRDINPLAPAGDVITATLVVSR